MRTTSSNNLYHVGMDVHKETIMISVIKKGEKLPEFEKQIRNEPIAIRKFFKHIQEQGEVTACYEAGFCGYSIYRTLNGIGVPCVIAAPGLLPRKPGDRIKTDRRDARMLAQNLQKEEVTAIYVPSQKDEAVRDYLRMYDDMRRDLKRAKLRLLHFLLRHGKKYDGKTNWTKTHETWLKHLVFEEPRSKKTFDEYFYHIKDMEGKIERIQSEIDTIVNDEDYKEEAEALKCFKGIENNTALSCISEIGDFTRFSRADEFMSFLGLVPSENSSGPKHQHGKITKAGNSRLRRLLIESAWSYMRYNEGSKRLLMRRKGQPREKIAYADKAGRRLNKKFLRLIFKGKKSQIAVVAVARELAGFIWGMMTNHIS